MAAPPLDSPCDGPVTYPGDIKNTRKILKKKKRTDTQYDKARFDEQRIGKLKAATWNAKGIAEKTEELQTELLKRYTCTLSLTSALDVGGSSTPPPGGFTPRIDPVPIV